MLSLWFLLAMLGTTVSATTYYVSQNGNDSNSGTGTSNSMAFRTISKGLNAAVAGDTVFLLGGSAFTLTTPVTFPKSGSSGLPIILTSDSANPATITCTTTRCLSMTDKSFITVSNLKLVGVTPNANSNGIEASSSGNGLTFRELEIQGFYRGVYMWRYGSGTGFSNFLIEGLAAHDCIDAGLMTWADVGGMFRNFVIRDSTFSHNLGDPSLVKNTGSGLVIGQGADGLVERCVAHHNGGRGGGSSGGPVGLWCYDSARIVFQFCESYANKAQRINGNVNGSPMDGDGFDMDLGSQDCIIQYCYSHDNEGAGFLFSDGGATGGYTTRNNTVRYCVSENDGIVHLGAIHFYQRQPLARAYGNTVHTARVALGFCLTSSTVGAMIKNNLFVGSGASNKLVQLSANTDIGTSKFDMNNNLYYQTGGSYQLGQSTSFSGFQATYGVESFGLNVDPLFVGVGSVGVTGIPFEAALASRYALTAASPAINKGASIAGAQRDLAGAAVPQENIFDLGAFEYSAGQTTTPVATTNPATTSTAATTTTTTMPTTTATGTTTTKASTTTTTTKASTTTTTTKASTTTKAPTTCALSSCTAQACQNKTSCQAAKCQWNAATKSCRQP